MYSGNDKITKRITIMVLINIISLIFFCIIVPYHVGLLITFKFSQNKDSFVLNMVCGYITYFGILEVMTLLCFKFDKSLNFLITLFVICFLCITIVSIVVNRKRIVNIFYDRLQYIKKYKINWIMIIAILIVLAQTYFVATKQHNDDDDAYYIGTAETAFSTNSVMKYDPYTGNESSPSSRYILSPLPIYHAVMGKLTGVKPVEYAHTLHPVFMIPLGYMVMYLVSTVFFENERKLRGYFLLGIALINTFSNYSVYSQGTFFMFRIWQGKAMLCSIIIPAIMYFTLSVKDKIKILQWLMLLLVMMSACFVSSMGIILGAISLGCMTIAHFLSTRNWKTTLALGSCTLPNVILLAIYMNIR